VQFYDVTALMWPQQQQLDNDLGMHGLVSVSSNESMLRALVRHGAVTCERHLCMMHSSACQWQ
jgi:hypothetical protein